MHNEWTANDFIAMLCKLQMKRTQFYIVDHVTPFRECFIEHFVQIRRNFPLDGTLFIELKIFIIYSEHTSYMIHRIIFDFEHCSAWLCMYDSVCIPYTVCIRLSPWFRWLMSDFVSFSIFCFVFKKIIIDVVCVWWWHCQSK